MPEFKDQGTNPGKGCNLSWGSFFVSFFACPDKGMQRWLGGQAKKKK
jgi:hypothetical protein